ncbi:hypothetical protein VKT23_003503 [Stygiomarasmius scandens]|uniref:Uncharacterized protein n=1 Tax=Marasmiellus scandens TaxID=2682957 RepID=A0ABR1K3W3_9AGAR
MTSSSQTKPREPNSHVFRLIFYLELSPGPAKYSLIFAPMMWCCLSVVTLPLCLDEFAKDRRLLPLMYTQFYVSIILLRHYLSRQEDGMVGYLKNIGWMITLYPVTEIYYDGLAHMFGATDYDTASLRVFRLYREWARQHRGSVTDEPSREAEVGNVLGKLPSGAYDQC